MINLNKIVNDSLAQIEAEGFAEKVIKARLEKTIESTVDELLRDWSDFGKSLKKQVNDQLNINFKELKIAGYNHMVLNVVKERLDEIVYTQGLDKIKESLDRMLVDQKKEYKLSELIDEMKKHATEYNDNRYGQEISLHLDPRRDILTFIYFDEDPRKEQYQCKYRLVLDKEGNVSSAEIKERKFDNRVIMGGLHGFEETMFKLYASGAKVIVDEDEVDVEYGSGDDDDE